MPLSAQMLRWPDPPLSLNLNPTEIHVWLIDLDGSLGEIERLSNLLSVEEQSRAERFATATLKNRFIVGRGSLREIVSDYLNCCPVDLPIGYGLHGKPELLADCDLQFNLSHSEGLALFAVSTKRRVGIDLESVHRVADVERIAQHYFSASEYTRLVSLPSEERSQYFLTCWTAREAYLKATGEGLYGMEGLQHVELASRHRVFGWSICTLAPLPGFVATLVGEGQGWHPRCWQWDGQSTLRRKK